MKILIIRLSSIGDVLLTTPVVRAMKKEIEGVELHYVTKEGNASMLVTNKNISKVWTYDRGIAKRLAEEKYDYVVDLHNVPRSRKLRRALGVRSLVYKKENFHKCMSVLTKKDFMSGRHVVDRYFDAVKSLGVKNDGGGLDLTLPEIVESELMINYKVNHKTMGEFMTQPFVAIAVGAQHATKRIPFDKLRMLCYSLKMPVVLLGDERDKRRMSDWGLTFDKRVVNLCGKTSILDSAAIISHAKVVVTADSAMMHVAAAFHKPVVALWGATDPSFGFTAYKTEHYDCVVDNLWCHPCSRMGGERCPLRHYKCMHLQKWQQIAAGVNKLSEN